jgi:hypothetical protein
MAMAPTNQTKQIVTHIFEQTFLLSPKGRFVSMVCLPGLVFYEMVHLDIHNINWTFVAAVTIVKSCIFALVAVASWFAGL